jgi:hypothetical protein
MTDPDWVLRRQADNRAFALDVVMVFGILLGISMILGTVYVVGYLLMSTLPIPDSPLPVPFREKWINT